MDYTLAEYKSEEVIKFCYTFTLMKNIVSVTEKNMNLL